MRQLEQYKHLQKSKFQDKGREETDKGEENIPKKLAGDKTAIEIRTREYTYIKGKIGKYEGEALGGKNSEKR